MLSALLTSFLLVSSPACQMTWPQAAAELQASHATVVELKPEQRAIFQTNFNAVPPQTHITLDHVYIATKGGAPQVLVVIVIAGCVADAEPVSVDALTQLMTPHGNSI